MHEAHLRRIIALFRATAVRSKREHVLATGHRLDLAIWHADGSLTGVEFKRTISDLNRDTKWPLCMIACTRFYIAGPRKVAERASKFPVGVIAVNQRRAFFLKQAPNIVSPARH
jgi:hypothetical protein